MKKRILIIGGIVVLVIVLAGAAFVGGRLLTGQGLPGLSSGPEVSTGPGGRMSIRIRPGDIQPAKELPQTPADVGGVFDHRKDNSIYVGTAQISIMTKKDQSRNEQTSASHTGPVVEVVVSPQTIVYKDVTMQQFNGPPPAGQKIQQVVEPGSLDEVGQYSSITAWGKKTGDRIIADVLVYTLPPVMNARP